MTTPSQFYVYRHLHYAENLLDEINDAKIAADVLLSIDWKTEKSVMQALFSNEDTEFLIAILLYHYYKSLCLYADQKVLDQFKKASSKTYDTKLFIHYKDIENQFTTISDQGIKIDKVLALMFIKKHLCNKFLKDVMMSLTATIHDKTDMTLLSKKLIALKKKRASNRWSLKKYKDQMDSRLNRVINEWISIPDGKEDIPGLKFDFKSFAALAKGKSEASILRLLVDECFEFDGSRLTKTQFLSIIYDLLRMLMQDRNLLDETAFKKLDKDISYFSWEYYKAKTLKAILYPKKAK